jgi:hypothetical protein
LVRHVRDVELTARVFDTLVWQLDGPRGPLNFLEVQSHEEVEVLAPSFEVVRRDKDPAVRREYMRMAVHQSDEAYMVAYRGVHLEHVAP